MNTYEESPHGHRRPPPSGVAGNNRDIRWLTQANVIGVARDRWVALVFLAGPQLTPRTATLKSAIRGFTRVAPRSGTAAECDSSALARLRPLRPCGGIHLH